MAVSMKTSEITIPPVRLKKEDLPCLCTMSHSAPKSEQGTLLWAFKVGKSGTPYYTYLTGDKAGLSFADRMFSTLMTCEKAPLGTTLTITQEI